MENTKPDIAVILGSVREGRNGEKVAKWFMKEAGQNQSANLRLVDLLDYPLPIYADSDVVKNRSGAHPNPAVQKWLDVVESADGYIIITPEYNRSFSSVLKNAIDYGYKQWNNKPVGFVSYGAFAGGARAVEQLRTIAAELQMYDVRDHVSIAKIWQAFGPDGKLTEDNDRQEKTANAIVEKVAELAVKLKS